MWGFGYYARMGTMLETLLHLPDTSILASTVDTGMIDEDSWIGRLQGWVEGLPPTLQWLGIILISSIPFIESYTGALIAVVAGIHPVVAVFVASLGNMLSLILVVYIAHGVRSSVTKRTDKPVDEKQQARREKIKRIFDKFGVPGVSLLGPFALPSQITAPIMVSFGASRNAVMVWMLISVIVWGIGFGLLGWGLLQLLS